MSLSVFVLKHILKHFFCPLFLHFPTEVISDLLPHIVTYSETLVLVSICSQHKLSPHLRLMKAPGTHSDLPCLTTCLITWQM